MTTEAREHLLDWLRDAHAMEQQAEKMLKAQAERLEHYPELKARIANFKVPKHIFIEPELPRNANPTRIRNRCEITGRPRAYYRKFRLARVMLRDLANKGLIPGVVKSSW
mgnify:CR=1 FL=1